MSAAVLSRVSGALLILGGALGVAVPLAHPSHGPAYYTDHMTAPVHLLLLAAVLLVSLGLPGVVAVQPARWQRWAAAGATLVFVGEWLLDGTHAIVDGAVLPALVQQGVIGAAHGATRGVGLAQALAAGPLGTLVNVGVPIMIAGCLVTGIILLRAGTLSRIAAVLLAGCWILVPVSFVVPAVRGPDVALPYVAFAALGIALLRPRAARAPHAREAPPATPLAGLATAD